MNNMIFLWFNNGLLKEALIGKGKFFIRDHTYRDKHDVILIISQMIEWVDEEDIENFGDIFENIIIEIINEELFVAVEVLIAFFILKEVKDILFDFNANNISTVLKNKIKEKSPEIVNNEFLRSRIILLSKYFPEILH